jgi:phytoene dehydrogenase-like protein
MKSPDVDVVIVGAGPAGLSCARHLMKRSVPCIVLEADDRIGGRLKTDVLDGFILNHGFQVLQTAYPEARRQLDYHRLDLKPFAPGAMIRASGKFYRISDPRRRPRDIWSSLTAPIGTFADRLRMIRMALSARLGSVSDLFQRPDMTALEFLQSQGISEKMIQRFFMPFFGGVCLDPGIQASSRVFNYVLRVFAEGDVALPGQGMGAIARVVLCYHPVKKSIAGRWCWRPMDQKHSACWENPHQLFRTVNCVFILPPKMRQSMIPI